MNSFREVIAAWPARQAFADDIRVDVGLVKQWERRDSIPARYWRDVVAKAHDREIPGVTLDALAGLAARQVAA